ncbi:MAG: hypothetical protein LBM38_04465 [Clostridiales bacterium]|jgi:stage III sporulation protein AG|nr:hypothetical protein [Clostridiales bacterium]
MSTKEIISKYWVYLLLLLGIIIFLCFGNSGANNATATQESATTEASITQSNKEYIADTESKLTQTLQEIKGAGKVSVMVTLKSSSQLVLASDEKYSSNTSVNNGAVAASSNVNITSDTSSGGITTPTNSQTSRDTQIATLKDQPVVLQELQPKVEGVVVIASGANNEEVALDINNAVIALLDVKPHKVVVLNKANDK